jgi:hypothetical protein
MRSDDSDRVLGEAEIKRVLARAAELDSRSELLLTTTDLRRIASEAHISSEALELALREVRAASHAATDGAVAEKRAWWRRALLGAGLVGGGALLAVVAVMADRGGFGPAAAAAVFGPSAAFGLYRALRHRWHGSLVDFQKEMALVLGTFALTITAVEGYDATQVALVWWAICAVVGGAIVQLTLRSSDPSDAPQALTE